MTANKPESVPAAISRSIRDAARAHLAPLGLQQRGRSRLWFDDRIWYQINVEFQPSRSPGTYLNIGVMWLWCLRDYWAFDEGYRMHWRHDGSFAPEIPLGATGWSSFVDYYKAEQFRDDIDSVAHIAAQRVQQLRKQFPDPGAAAAQLTTRPTRVAESRWWHLYHSGAAAGLSGDADTARRCFAQITPAAHEPEWAHDLARQSAALNTLPDDALRTRLVEIVHAARDSLKLPAAKELPMAARQIPTLTGEQSPSGYKLAPAGCRWAISGYPASMTEPETDYERWRQAERELGGDLDGKIRPVEETEEVAEAIEDEAPVTGLEQLAARQAQAAEAGGTPDKAPATGLDQLAARQAEAPEAGGTPDEETEPTRHTTPERLAEQTEAGQGDGEER